MSDRCNCQLCRRHRRLRYIQHELQRIGDEPAAEWLGRMFDHMLDLGAELEMERASL